MEVGWWGVRAGQMETKHADEGDTTHQTTQERIHSIIQNRKLITPRANTAQGPTVAVAGVSIDATLHTAASAELVGIVADRGEVVVGVDPALRVGEEGDMLEGEEEG